MIPIGRICAINRYPVKSMAGVSSETAALGWHGLAGDRRFAFRRLGDAGSFPWLTASRLPDLLRYRPVEFEERGGEPSPTHVLTPSGSRFGLQSAELRDEIAERLGSPVEMMWLRNGIFDDAAVSLIAGTTIAHLGREGGLELDPRRFRANIVIESDAPEPFHEDAWVGKVLVFGDADSAGPAVSVTQRDLRCSMINLDPDTAEQDARVMKTVARLNAAHAGVYATVVRCGAVRVGDRVGVVREASQ
ncbi:MAG TPA: MOSC domain-containing protein [Planctomycetota bacterium]|nr:MOSC domain-containing protein [Planctomycetota bacterium]